MNDEEILDLYFARQERAVEETAKKYGDYCRSVAGSILRDAQDVEEVLSETWFRAWSVIPPQRPKVMKLFLAKITRNLSFSLWRKSTAEKRGRGELDLVLEELGNCLASGGSIDDHLNEQELIGQIQSFLNTLSRRDRNIFLRRYFFVEESEQIAKRYGMKTAAVQQGLSRTRKKLKNHLSREGYPV